MNAVHKSKKIVIIGGGAAGLELAIRLSQYQSKRIKLNITLIDESLKHVWKPLYHEVATGTLALLEDEISYLQLSHSYGFKFVLGSLSHLNRKDKVVTVNSVIDDHGIEILPKRSVSYDSLIIAIGSISNSFNIPGVNEYCYRLDKGYQAELFHKMFFNHILKLIQSDDKNASVLRIVIIGGGATGIELAAEIRYSISTALAIGTYHRKLHPGVKITLIEAADRLLANLPPAFSQKMTRMLNELGITILTSQKVKEITPQSVITSHNASISSDFTIWAAGIRAEKLLSHLDGLEVNHLDQLCVRQTLQVTKDDAIFALGDCASCPQPDRGFVPPRAQAAHQQATHLAKSLIKHIHGKPLPHYHYRDYGSLVTLSHYNVIGTLMGRYSGHYFIEGRLARFFYWLLYKSHQIRVLGVWKTCVISISHFLTSKVKVRLKLH
jgi:NADH dehydrogenase